MTARLGTVAHVERSSKDGVPTVEVHVEIGDETITAELMQEPGVDALPLPGDEVAIEEAEGAGDTIATAFADPKNTGTAEEGERRQYARDAEGTLVCEIWQKKDGTIVLKSIASGSKLDLNGVLIDQQGNIVAPGEITAMAGTPEAPLPGVKVSQHLHPTGVGPSGPPTPGT